MQRLLVLNLFISMLWPILNSDYTLRNLLIGFAFGFVLMSIVQRKYGLYTYRAARFLGFVLWAILQSNLRLAAKVLAGAVGMQTSLRPGIVAVPLDLTNPFDITVLATVITLTPGTLTVDLGEDESGQLWPYGETVEDTIGLDAERVELRPQPSNSPSQHDFHETTRQGRGEAALLVHTIDIGDPAAFREDIKQNFENPLLELRRLIEDLDLVEN